MIWRTRSRFGARDRGSELVIARVESLSREQNCDRTWEIAITRAKLQLRARIAITHVNCDLTQKKAFTQTKTRSWKRKGDRAIQIAITASKLESPTRNGDRGSRAKLRSRDRNHECAIEISITCTKLRSRTDHCNHAIEIAIAGVQPRWCRKIVIARAKLQSSRIW